MLEVTGNGDVIESHDGVLAIGSGGPLAAAAARALIDTELSAGEISTKARHRGRAAFMRCFM